MNENFTLTHNAAEARYEMDIEGAKVYVEYELHDGVITLTHTFVPERLEGRGIGSRLVKAMLEEARAQGWKVIPQCQFIAQWIFRHPEWEQIVKMK